VSIELTSQDAERQELERAIELLGRKTRLGRLLEYLGAKYFQHQEEQLTEFTIATEVFGRSEKNFDSTEDAVVRVEAHRLRKKLRDIYEKDGRTQGVQISLPAGTYVPRFTVAPEPPPDTTEPAPAPANEQVANTVAGARRVPAWAWSLAIVAVLVVVVVGTVMNGQSRDVQPAAPQSQAAQIATSSTGPSDRITELHVMAGHDGSEVIDNSGVRWTPDRYFVAGGQWSRDSGFVRGTSRPFLFATWRTGEFGYDIPMEPGSYEMRLFFVSPSRVGDEKLAGFNVSLNGKPLLDAFDVTMSANGADVAEEQVFRDVTPDEKGFVHLWFSNQVGSPLLNGLELTPGIPGKLRPIRILMQPTSFVDHKGQRWRADDYYINGFRSTERRKVDGTEDPELFGAERFGHFSYAIPVDKRGRYTVVLHFAEFYYGPQLPGGGGAGSRVFHVFCNGQTLLRDFDTYKEAGSLRVVSKTFRNIKPSAQGKLNLTFEPVVNNATVSGIEVLEESN
jgi:Malectin domain